MDDHELLVHHGGHRQTASLNGQRDQPKIEPVFLHRPDDIQRVAGGHPHRQQWVLLTKMLQQRRKKMNAGRRAGPQSQ